MSYTASVNSPCTGDQTLDEISSSLYQGTSGNFSVGVLISDATQGWLLTIIETGSGSSCYPSITYGQVTPNSSDPTGTYGEMVNGSPDTGSGEASIL